MSNPRPPLHRQPDRQDQPPGRHSRWPQQRHQARGQPILDHCVSLLPNLRYRSAGRDCHLSIHRSQTFHDVYCLCVGLYDHRSWTLEELAIFSGVQSSAWRPGSWVYACQFVPA
jgi:hypothetical protein